MDSIDDDELDAMDSIIFDELLSRVDWEGEGREENGEKDTEREG